MANSFIDALQSTALDIGSKAPQTLNTKYRNVTGVQPSAGMPKFKTSTPSTLPTSIKQLGNVTVRPGESTRFEKSHPGIDIANTIGTQLPAFTGGAVTAVQTGQRQGSPGYGNYVIITDKNGNKHRYSHLDGTTVKMGDQIQPGQSVGTMGNTGQTYSLSGGTGSHLDYRIQDAYGKYVDPDFYVRQLLGTNI